MAAPCSLSGVKYRAGQRAAGVQHHLVPPSVTAFSPLGKLIRQGSDCGVRRSDQQNRGILQPGVGEIGGNSHPDEPHGPARCRRLARGDESNRNA